MGFKCGIVGLPNVGKSTLFNALTQTAAAQAANYPFCTIEPNVGNVAVPDERLQKLAAIAKSAKVIETQLGFVDIAGLVRGASKGEGLGNQFLGNIREVDAIVHVLRCFENGDVTHVEGKVDPVADAETVEAIHTAAGAPRDPRDPSGFVGHLDFHTTVLMATGNLMITMMGQPANDVLRTRLRRVGVEAAEWDRVDEWHRVIAGHIAAGEAEAAEEAMRDHLIALRPLYERDGLWAEDPLGR